MKARVDEELRIVLDDPAAAGLSPGTEIGVVITDPGQEWFWSEEWQAKEREVDEHLAAGRTECFDSSEAFLAALEASAKPGVMERVTALEANDANADL